MDTVVLMTLLIHLTRESTVLYEQTIFCQNAILFFLTLALADDVFDGVHSCEDILALKPFAGHSMLKLRYKPEKEKLPVIRTVKEEGPTNRPLTGSQFQHHLASLGHRAGYADNVTIHGIRRAVANSVDSNYTEAQRCQFMAHRSGEFENAYMSKINFVDGQASFHGRGTRQDHIQFLRGMTANRVVDLPQCISKTEKKLLQGREDYQAIERDLEAVNRKLISQSPEDLLEESSQGLLKERQSLYSKKGRLVKAALDTFRKNWTDIQYGPGLARQLSGSKRKELNIPSMFSLIRHYLPERDRLADALFCEGSVREIRGQAILRDLLSLCIKPKEVFYRKGQEPVNGRCPVASCRKDIQR